MQKRRKSAVVGTGIACLILVGSLLAGMPVLAIAAKFVASLGFIAVAIASGALHSAYGRTIVAGLTLSLCGDLFLTGNSENAFLSGLSAFLLAHLAYVAAFLKHGINRRWAGTAAVPIILVAIAVSAWLLPFTPPNLTAPVLLYTGVISAMVIAAIGTRGNGGTLLIVVGALLFFVSDLSVAAQQIVQSKVPTYILGLPLYYAGQVCLALSTSQSRSH